MDDRRFVDRVASGREADPCSYRCHQEGCTESTSYQSDKTATGMRLVTYPEGFEPWPGVLPPAGRYTCRTHAPRVCRHCGQIVPWFDGSVCDYCDRYADEGG